MTLSPELRSKPCSICAGADSEEGLLDQIDRELLQLKIYLNHSSDAIAIEMTKNLRLLFMALKFGRHKCD